MEHNEPKRPRGRPRAYDPEDALARATQSFWRRGYAATSLDDLCAAMDMNRPSLYGAFGDKHALYLAALERYIGLARGALAEALRPELPLAESLSRVYERALALYFADPEAPLGCFLIGTAATEAAHDSGVRGVLAGGLREFNTAFAARFRAARDAGEIAPNADPALLAELAGAVLHSLALRSRAGDSRAALRRFSRDSVRLLCDTAGAKPRSRRRRGARRSA